ncbi:beta-lactamase family protein [Clostridium sp. D2Q-11]|uniref:Beta-lactamase family protein n=1 Tax=Anaeromonas frigoriresistens TaxID=2683708 RepID=A0A942UZX5_9FIRM|nr:serine hydrolase domain-containing protein [Anaeromonas frigoriresistens]MBS4539356.1 beta-lactamase family protein [Anaeromonas frigoriresistens]
MESKIDTYFKKLEENQQFSGTVLVAKGEGIILKESYGVTNHTYNIPNTINSKFLIASITKSITAMAIMILEEENKLNVHDTLDKYIPDFLNGDKITIHNLLNHSSGIWGDPNFLDIVKKSHTMDELIDRYKNKPLDFEPGDRFEYSNMGYTLLAYIIEKVSRKKYEEFIKENIFKKLSMKDTGCYRNENIIKDMASGYEKKNNKIINSDIWDFSNFKGSGDIYSTIEDLYKWTEGLVKGKLLSEEYNTKLLEDYGLIYDNFYYGYGKIFYKKNDKIEFFYQDGGLPGFKSIYVIYPPKDLTIILLSNYSFIKTPEIVNRIEEILYKEGPLFEID